MKRTDAVATQVILATCAEVDEYRDLLLRILGFESSIERAVLPMKELDSSCLDDVLFRALIQRR